MMDGWLKALIGAACAVVIAGGGYFALGEYQSMRTRQKSEALAADLFATQKIERERLASLSAEECMRMAKETLPDIGTYPPKTEKYKKALWTCDDLGRFDSSWHQALDKAGIF